jgi:Peptidase family M23
VRRALLAAVGLAIALPSVVAAQPGLPFKLLMLPSPGTPEVFSGDGNTHVAYEFFLANFTDQTIQIDSLAIGEADANSGETPVSSVQANLVNFGQLKSLFSLIGADPRKPQAPVLKPSEAGVIFLFRDDWNLEKWTNQLTVEAQGKPQTRQKVVVDMNVSRAKPVVIGAPLRGKNWWTPNGPANDSVHRRVVVALANHLGLPERFAVDWVQLGADGNSFTGNQADNRSYHCYGAEVLAVANGKVVGVKDGIMENVPNAAKMAVPITLETIGGNYVMEDIGGGRYAFYAHLIPGTIGVKVGDSVKAGEPLAKLGNSGNSTEPHLHFHICDGPNPLFCNGLPFEIDHFTRYDYQMEMKGEHPVKFVVGAPHQVTDEIFMNRDLGEFTSAN